MELADMTYEQDTSSNAFFAAWPGGYQEDFQFYPLGAEALVAAEIARRAHGHHECLEIGPGRGLWTTRYLLPAFARVTCIELFDQPGALASPRLHWLKAGDRDFSCAGVPDSSIDFAFSFGVFCHLSRDAQAAYLRSIYRVLRSGSGALIAFANWPRHGSPAPENRRFANERHAEGTCWFYNDLEMTRTLVSEAGFVDFLDTLPEFRDTLASFRKP